MTTPGPSAVVTGGGSGIGAEVARHWLAAGGRVVLVDRDAAAVEAMAEGLGPRAMWFEGDVQDHVDVENAVRAAGDSFDGTIDAVVNCAGIAGQIDAEHGSDAEWTRMVDIHLGGTMRVCRAAVPFLRRSARGSIVNLSSVAAGFGFPFRSHYAAAKAGVEALTRVLSAEWAPDVRVNCVAPGYVQTPLNARLMAAAGLDSGPVIARTPMRRFGTRARSPRPCTT